MNKTLKQLEIENAVLRGAVGCTMAMARRYAYGRMTFAADTVNRVIDSVTKLGIVIEDDVTSDDPRYAEDGSLRLLGYRECSLH